MGTVSTPDTTAAPLPVAPSSIASAERTPAGTVSLRLTGRAAPIEDVRVRRCFPWSAPDSHISILDKDGKEVALLASWAELAEPVRAVLQEELHHTLFHPRVRRITDHRNELGVLSVTAETDRGTVTFQVRTRDDVRSLTPSQMLLRDADGNAYEITDIAALDPDSQRALDEYS